MIELGVSERRACWALGQHRSTQRRASTAPDDEAVLTADIVSLPANMAGTVMAWLNFKNEKSRQ
jgi:hypothetical protein